MAHFFKKRIQIKNPVLMLQRDLTNFSHLCQAQCDQIGQFIGLWQLFKAFSNN